MLIIFNIHHCPLSSVENSTLAASLFDFIFNYNTKNQALWDQSLGRLKLTRYASFVAWAENAAANCKTLLFKRSRCYRLSHSFLNFMHNSLVPSILLKVLSFPLQFHPSSSHCFNFSKTSLNPSTSCSNPSLPHAFPQLLHLSWVFFVIFYFTFLQPFWFLYTLLFIVNNLFI